MLCYSVVSRGLKQSIDLLFVIYGNVTMLVGGKAASSLIVGLHAIVALCTTYDCSSTVCLHFLFVDSFGSI